MEWRIVPGYTCYEVSEIGDLRCVELRGKMRKFGPVTKRIVQGYVRYSVINDQGFHRTEGGHRLVALAFLKPSDDAKATFAFHNNGIRRCNHWSNLRWGTPSENSADAMRHNRVGAGILDVPAVRAIRASTEDPSVLAKRYGVFRATVEAVLNGVSWRHV